MSNVYEPPREEHDRRDGLDIRRLGWVPLLAALMLVLGILEALLAIFFFIEAAVVGPMMAMDPHPNPDDPPPAVVIALFVVLTLIVGVVGGLHITSAVQLLRYRGRTLAFVALGAGLVTVLTCYCFPFNIALFVFGLVALLDPTVARALELGSQGLTIGEIRQRLFGR